METQALINLRFTPPVLACPGGPCLKGRLHNIYRVCLRYRRARIPYPKFHVKQIGGHSGNLTDWVNLLTGVMPGRKITHILAGGQEAREPKQMSPIRYWVTGD